MKSVFEILLNLFQTAKSKKERIIFAILVIAAFIATVLLTSCKTSYLRMDGKGKIIITDTTDVRHGTKLGNEYVSYIRSIYYR